MKRTMATATFVMIGAGAAGAGAVNLPSRGSDTLFKMLTDVLADADCGGGADELTYVGGGSGNGQTAMQLRQQEVAGMSSFLNTTTSGGGTCNHQEDGANAEGIVWALDGLAILGKDADTNTCGGADGGGGLRFAGSVDVLDLNDWPDGVAGDGDIDLPAGVTDPYVLGNTGGAANAWKDVLNILYFGIHNNTNNNAMKHCGSDLRYTLANNWDELFENACAGGTGTCGRVEHILRRGDDSGTTDVFRALVSGGGAATEFCNAGASLAQGGGNGGSNDGNLLNDDQMDADPIRRTCRLAANPAAANKRTCSTYFAQTLTGCTGNVKCGSATATQAEKDRAWSLGLVLSVTPPEDEPALNRYPACGETCNQITQFRAPQVPPGFPVNPSRCPCGEALIANSCKVPSFSGNFGCNNNFLKPPNANAACDAKVYNNEIRNDDGSMALDPTNRQYISSAYRLRTCFASGNCNELDATTQIGCIATNSSCMIGFAGREACDTVAGIDCIEVDDDESTATNVRSGQYVASRNLYLNTMIGFEEIDNASICTDGFCSGDAGGPSTCTTEDALPNCFATSLVAGTPSRARTAAQLQAQVDLAGCLSQENLTEDIIIEHGFITLYDPNDTADNPGGDGVSDARCVRCRDFNSDACGIADTEACSNNELASVTPTNGVPLPDHATVDNNASALFDDSDPDGLDPGIVCERCGDGNTDIGEECDDGNRTDLDGCDADCFIE